ncbi:hypothetical protein BCV70DRAFT_202197 [Testicularia cyperi]|uniref:Chitobiosyldiphosphodolichol beta-mannosyltransferase n=1 Tax=Testicularia cyperi TaxID=1882483 RepID=A0A317XIA8_9BASI|nr:hypothetical protein BCV70DRAFT_202197 [Testicularia cyperi]
MLLWLILLAFCGTLIPLVGLLCLCIYIVLYRSVRGTTSAKSRLGRSAAVVVLGDIGRSPRMCMHVESLANEGWKVAVIGYAGVSVPAPLRRPSVRHHHLRTPPSWIGRLPRKAFILVAPFKVLLQSVSLFLELGTRVQPPPEIVLVQTPPALPTLFIVKAVSILIKAKVVIDWHNLGYTILALRMGTKSPLVRLAERLERWTGRNAYAHLFVTAAMKNHLSLKWRLEGKKSVLHDRPPAHFRRSTVAETHNLLCKLMPTLQPSVGADFLPEHEVPRSTAFTRLQTAAAGQLELRPESPSPARNAPPSLPAGTLQPQWREDRPALVVSSTSWTADEDFGLLLAAARIYERRARYLADPASRTHSRNSTNGDSGSSLTPVSPASSTQHGFSFASLGSDTETARTSKERRRPSLGALRSATLPNEPATTLPKILILVTGKGELKAQYVAQIAKLEREEEWQFVRIRTAWLESEDYPTLLGSADVGVSLHSSSSGLDLPMKVVDMLGCGLPVCALDFACLDELVQDRSNGLIFRDAEGLARQLESLLANHPSPNWLSCGPGMQEPFERLREGSRPATPLFSGAAGSIPTPVPMSPNPSMTLLHSPILGATNGMFAQRSRTSTWAGNWKSVVRPLIDGADDEDGQEAGGSGKSSIPGSPSRTAGRAATSALKLSSPGGMLQRRTKRGSRHAHHGETSTDDSEREAFLASSPTELSYDQESDGTSHTQAEQLSSTIPHAAATGYQLSPMPPHGSDNEADGDTNESNELQRRSSRLRQRKSLSQRAATVDSILSSTKLDSSINDSPISADPTIPHIQVSHHHMS